MKRKLIALAFLGVLSLSAQQAINFGSPVPAVGTYSTTAAWNTFGGYTFEVGAFSLGFTPTSGNVGSWQSNWTIANQGASGTTTWIDDGGDTGFSGAGGITVLSGPFVGNASLYIWGFDSKAVGAREWILLTNTSWVVPSDISSPGTTNMIVNGSTSTILGSVANSGATLQSSLVVVSAIPEPSTFAVLIGLASLGLCAARRRRRV